MIKDQVQKQEGGDSSTNLQGKSIVINQGITYKDAKEIALDVYKANYLKLGEEAALLASKRAEELTDDFLAKLKEKNENTINSLNQPGMQMAIYTAQKAYATTGDKDLEKLLVDILIERAAEDKRTIKQITLDESLIVASKLTIEQLDALTINFIISKTKNYTINNIDTLQKYLNTYIAPFIDSLESDSSCFEHLEYAGCGSIMETARINPIEHIFKDAYAGIFCKGFTKDEFIKQIGDIEKYSKLVTNCLIFPEKLQINAIDQNVLSDMTVKNEISQEDKDKLIALFKSNIMNNQEVKDKIIELCPKLVKLFDLWSSTKLSKFTLTTVGIAIAQANLRSKQGIELNLSVWVK